jgi:hypothetical protein
MCGDPITDGNTYILKVQNLDSSHEFLKTYYLMTHAKTMNEIQNKTADEMIVFCTQTFV